MMKHQAQTMKQVITMRTTKAPRSIMFAVALNAIDRWLIRIFELSQNFLTVVGQGLFVSFHIKEQICRIKGEC